MAAQHTPGKWELAPDQEGCIAVITGLDSKFPLFKVCRVWHTRPKNNMEDIGLANARLIASAPCLLKALERFANIDKTTNSDLWAINASYCEAARAAIAAAKGE